MVYRQIKVQLIAALLIGASACGAATPTAQQERSLILDVVGRLAAAEANCDHAEWSALTEAEGVWFTQSIDTNWKATLSHQTAQSRFATVSTLGNPATAHFWNEQVFQNGPVANYWAPYAKQRSDQVVECGTVSFSLIKVDGAWKVATSTRTTRTFLCQQYRTSQLELKAAP